MYNVHRYITSQDLGLFRPSDRRSSVNYLEGFIALRTLHGLFRKLFSTVPIHSYNNNVEELCNSNKS